MENRHRSINACFSILLRLKLVNSPILTHCCVFQSSFVSLQPLLPSARSKRFPLLAVSLSVHNGRKASTPGKTDLSNKVHCLCTISLFSLHNCLGNVLLTSFNEGNSHISNTHSLFLHCTFLLGVSSPLDEFSYVVIHFFL